MRFYLLQTGVEQSWQQQHLHLTWDGLDQDKWNYVFLPFCQAPYLSESMQLSPSRGEREEMWIAIAGRYSNWTLSILPFKSGVKWNFFLTGRKYTREGATEITVRQLNLKLYINSVTVCAFTPSMTKCHFKSEICLCWYSWAVSVYLESCDIIT